MLDGLVRSDVSLLQSNCEKAAPLYDGDLSEFFFFFYLLVVFKMDSREQLLAGCQPHDDECYLVPPKVR